MKFYKYNNTYRVLKISGPAHNLLGIEFEKRGTTTTNIEIISQQGHSDKTTVDGDLVVSQVFSALKEFNLKTSKDVRISKIEFVKDDTPSSYIYKELAAAIMYRILENKKFDSIS